VEQLTQEELARIQETMNEISQALAKSMQPLVESLQSLQKQWGKLTQGLQQSLLKLTQGLAERERIVQAFQACDLWLAPSMIELTDKVVQLYDDGKKQVIPSMITHHYKKNNWTILKKTVSNWECNRFFRPRMGIIYDALEAHINGKYTLSIPTLLPHIEGIAREIVKEYNLPKLHEPLICREVHCGKYGVKTWPSAVFGKVAINDFEGWVAAESLLYFLEGTLYISPGDFQKDLERLKRKSKLNRQSILHGVQIKYATSMNSLRCFLALDILSSLIDSYYGNQS